MLFYGESWSQMMAFDGNLYAISGMRSYRLSFNSGLVNEVEIGSLNESRTKPNMFSVNFHCTAKTDWA